MERRDAAPAAVDPQWAALKDEELLALRICDLGVRIEGSELEPRVAQLFEELGARGLAMRPRCYLGDEWFSPEGVPAISIPFYLAHPRLKALEHHQMLEVEGGTPEWCLRLLRHECGHAIDHAYRFSSRQPWREAFGSPDTRYTPESYRPRPYSKSFVRHLNNWYAQAHPDEDFAETFAVWLAVPSEQWRQQYHGWKALEKLAYVDELMKEAAQKPALVTSGRRISQASKLKTTLARYYAARRKMYAEDFPDFYDADLRAIFESGEPGEESAAQFMRRGRPLLVGSIVRWTGQRKYTVNLLVRWTGQRKYTVNLLVRRLIQRCRELAMAAPRDQARLTFDLTAYLAALLTNHLHTGRFKRL